MAKKATISDETRAIVMTRHAACVVCGNREANECGHIIAEAHGGGVEPENLLRMCGVCNRKQGAKNVSFAGYAKPISLSATYGEALATIDSRRAQWIVYLKRGEHGSMGRMAHPFKPQ
jgi:hypothetical protein